MFPHLAFLFQIYFKNKFHLISCFDFLEIILNQIEVMKQNTGLTLADRMKKYEDVSRHYIAPKQPIILRVDGKTFSSYTKQKWVKKPFDYRISNAFMQTMVKVCHEIQNVEFGYHQSDEVSFFLKDYKTKKQNQYFDGNVQKISSVVASTFTYWYNVYINEALKAENISVETLRPAIFDCRTFAVPMTEVTNYFIWRQRDAIRNSIAGYAQSIFSHKQLLNKNTDEMLVMIEEKSNAAYAELSKNEPDKKIVYSEADYLKRWQDLPTDIQRGTACKKNKVEVLVADLSEAQVEYYVKNNMTIPEAVQRNKWVLDSTIPKFSENREYIDDLVFSTEEPLFQPQQLELELPTN